MSFYGHWLANQLVVAIRKWKIQLRSFVALLISRRSFFSRGRKRIQLKSILKVLGTVNASVVGNLI